MFGLGLWEIAAVALVIVVFVKPSELPRAARAIGRTVRSIRTFSARASAEMRRLGDALEQSGSEPAAGTPPDEEIHPMQTEADRQDAAAPQGYSGTPRREDAEKR